MSYDIIAFGSAAQDINVKSKAFRTLKDKEDFATGEGLCLPLGSKVQAEEIVFATGGGGTNTSATFAKQGFKTAFCGAIGPDAPGLEIVRELKHLRIDTKFVVKKRERTNTSVIISGDVGDRTILVFSGASHAMCEKDIPLKKMKSAKWFYLAPLGGTFCQNFEKIVSFAKENGIKVAANPSAQQLDLPKEQLEKILKNIDILFLNQEEAAFLTKIPFKDVQGIFKKIDQICPGIAVMTKGGEGVVASDGKYLYCANPNPGRKIADTTGAGDSFASGFLSGYIRNDGSIEKAIQLGMANSEGNLAEIGAKSGLLAKDASFEPVKVSKEECGENNLCIQK